MSIRAALPVLLLLACAACGAPQTPDANRDRAQANAADYLRPPSVLTAEAGADGVFRIEGVAQPGARVQLIQADDSAIGVQADDQGHWSLTAPASPDVRLFVLTMTIGARTVGGEGYMMLAPDGRVALLRAASASQVLTPVTRRPKILSVDFDREGGAMIGGVSPAGSGMNIRVDHRPAGDVTADAQGRFTAAIRDKLGPGPHLIDISGDAGGDQIVVNGSPAPSLGASLFRAQRLDQAWRIDWMTPGGGLQSSIVVVRSETGA